MTAPRTLYVDGAPILSRDDAQALAKRVLAFSTADSTRVTIRSGARANSRFAVNQISTAGDNTDTVVSVLSGFGKRSATATTNKLDDAGLKAVVTNSEALARLSPEDPESMPELEPQRYTDSTSGWSEATAQLDPVARAAAIQKITEPARAAGLVSTGYIESRGTALAIANNKGLFAYSRTTEAVLTTTVRTADGQGSGWGGSAHWDWNRIDYAALGATAIQKAKASQNAVAIEPGRYTVVLEPTAVGNLVQLIAGAFNARSADEGRSFFTKQGGGNKIGMKVVDERVTLFSDPMDPDIATNPFAGDGLPLGRTVWIENGVVKNLSYDRYWALNNRAGAKATVDAYIQTQYKMWDTLDVPAYYARLTRPMLIQWGADGLVLPRYVGDDVAALFKGRPVKLIQYQGAGHLPMIEQPEATVRDAIAFLKAR